MHGVTGISEIRKAVPARERGAATGEDPEEGTTSDLPCRGAAVARLGPGRSLEPCIPQSVISATSLGSALSSSPGTVLG